MDERVRLFLRETGPVLCLDIGSDTQKALLARPGQECAAWPRWLLPSPARMVAQRIRELTLLRRGIWLYGSDMGGGFNPALRGHLTASLPLAATSEAARSIHDDLDVVRSLGVSITGSCPAYCVPVHLADYSNAFWEALLRLGSLPQPHMVLAAVQDHGDHDDGNRQGRMRNWNDLLARVPDPVYWVRDHAPAGMSRLAALQAETGGPVADTAACALLGALCDEEVYARSFRQGITIINAGSTHTLAALVHRGEVCGIYEHHTDKRELPLLLDDLRQFRLHWLPSEDVHASGGHGTAFGQCGEAAGDYAPTFILGPRRALLLGHGRFIAPQGDMPHAGCFGILRGWAHGYGRRVAATPQPATPRTEPETAAQAQPETDART